MDREVYKKESSRRKNLIKYQMVILFGYVTTQIGTIIAKELGFSSISYGQILFITIIPIVFTLSILFFCLSLKELSNGFLRIIEIIQFVFWLLMLVLWFYFLHEGRILGLFYVFMPLVYVIITQSPTFSFILVTLVIIIELTTSFYGIYFGGQKGTMKEMIFYIGWFAPSAFYIAYAAKLFHQKRSQLKIAKKEAEEAHSALWGEMEIAKKIQRILLPQNPIINNYEISHYMNPAEEVGGDYYDIINTDEKDWILIGDVSGHGVPAGLIMMMVQSTIRALINQNPTIKPSELLTIVNESIKYNIKNMNENRFMTITAFAIDPQATLLFSGRHEDVIYYDQNSDETTLIQSEGIIFSSWDQSTSDKNLELKIKVGDMLLLYTDGLIEAWNEGDSEDHSVDNMFGVDRLKRIFHENRKESPEYIKDQIISELKNFDVDDDVSIIIVKKIR